MSDFDVVLLGNSNHGRQPKSRSITLQVLLKEIEYVLDNYPEYPYQLAFSTQELRQKLISDVLKRMSPRYAVMEEAQLLPMDPIFLHRPLEEHLHLENLIRSSIYSIFKENLDWMICPINQQL